LLPVLNLFSSVTNNVDLANKVSEGCVGSISCVPSEGREPKLNNNTIESGNTEIKLSIPEDSPSVVAEFQSIESNRQTSLCWGVELLNPECFWSSNSVIEVGVVLWLLEIKPCLECISCVWCIGCCWTTGKCWVNKCIF
jgi:hypothetical protein